MSDLKRIETEHIINWNNAERMASVYTYSVKWQKHMEKIGAKLVAENSFGGRTYEFPKRWIRLPRPPRTRKISEEERKRLVAQLKKIRQKKEEQ